MSNLIMRVGSLGVDTSGIISPAQAKALVVRGCSFAIRALSVPGGNITPSKLTTQEIANIHAAGLALGLYQIFQTQPLSASRGNTDGLSAAQQARALGYPIGATIFGDSEGNTGVGSTAEVQYWTGWGNTLKAEGYAPAMYVGPGPAMTGSQIGAIPSIHGYWQAAAAYMPFPATRGYQMFQLNPTNISIGGQAFDLDCTQVDFKGGAPIFWLAEPASLCSPLPMGWQDQQPTCSPLPMVARAEIFTHVGFSSSGEESGFTCSVSNVVDRKTS